MAWRTAIALDEYRNEVNRRYPNRNKASDGTIGDNSHAGQGQGSDHNPWIVVNGVGVVRAFDLTHDPAHGVDCDKLSDYLYELARDGDPRLHNGGYLIFNGWITNSDWSAWRPYEGSNPHSHHMHISFSTDRFDQHGSWAAAFDDKAPPPLDWNRKMKSLVDGKEFTLEQFILFADYHANKAHEAADAALKLARENNKMLEKLMIDRGLKL